MNKNSLYENYLRIETIIPHCLNIEGRCEFTTNIKICDSFRKRKRKYTIFISKKLAENQEIPPSDNSFSVAKIEPTPDGLSFKYKYYVSRVIFGIQISNYERSIIENEHPNTIHTISELFQNIIIDFARYYNEAMNGNDYIAPSSNTYGPLIFSMHINNNKNTVCNIITNTFSTSRSFKGSYLDLTKCEQINWRYYLNKARNHYYLCEYIDTLLCAAISIESYVVELIKQAGLFSVLEDEKKNGRNISMFWETDLLYKNKVISKSKRNNINKLFSSIKDDRNNIVHGDRGPKDYEKKMANKGLNKLSNFYNKYEKQNIS